MTAVEELLTKLLLPARLLCVVSDKRQADALRQQIVQKYECAVDWAASGEEAKQKLSQHKYDLLLLEAVPQDVPASALLRHVKLTSPETPVVLVTGLIGSRVAEEASACGIVSVLARPVKQTDIDDLFRVFKVRVRTRENTQYFRSSSGLVAASA